MTRSRLGKSQEQTTSHNSAKRYPRTDGSAAQDDLTRDSRRQDSPEVLRTSDAVDRSQFPRPKGGRSCISVPIAYWAESAHVLRIDVGSTRVDRITFLGPETPGHMVLVMGEDEPDPDRSSIIVESPRGQTQLTFGELGTTSVSGLNGTESQRLNPTGLLLYSKDQDTCETMPEGAATWGTPIFERDELGRKTLTVTSVI